jgi:chromosome segregation ATPase
MGGEACGLGEGTHYGCECVTRRLAEAEARASGLESALAVAGEENAALTESRDAALRSLASEQARRETAERALEGMRGERDSEREIAVGWNRRAEEFEEQARDLAASLSAALRRAEEAEKERDRAREGERKAIEWTRDLDQQIVELRRDRDHAMTESERVADAAESEAAGLREALVEVRDLRANAALGITTMDVLVRIRETAARALSVGVSRTGGER